MSDNTYKTPLINSLNIFTDGKIDAANALGGKSLPCSVVSVKGAMITVKFEVTSPYTLPQITVPLAGAEYIRYPIKAGDKGFVVSADASLSDMSGQGGNTSSLILHGNLSALVFVPFGNTNWVVVDPNSLTFYANNNLLSSMTISPTRITLNAPKGVVITTQVNIKGSLNVKGNVIVGNGASGTFTTMDGFTVTVQDGIVTNIY